MAVRERINRVKIEHWRLSRVPVSASATIYQGDALAWNDSVHQATQLTAAASGAQFIGISDTTNPIETAGSTTFLSDTTKAYVNVIQKGLVEMIAGTSETMYPFNTVDIGADAQTVVKGSTNAIGIVDPGWATVSGKAVVLGDLVKIWLRVPKAYSALGQP